MTGRRRTHAILAGLGAVAVFVGVYLPWAVPAPLGPESPPTMVGVTGMFSGISEFDPFLFGAVALVLGVRVLVTWGTATRRQRTIDGSVAIVVGLGTGLVCLSYAGIIGTVDAYSLGPGWYATVVGAGSILLSALARWPGPDGPPDARPRIGAGVDWQSFRDRGW